jgi:hypothetical protein
LSTCFRAQARATCGHSQCSKRRCESCDGRWHCGAHALVCMRLWHLIECYLCSCVHGVGGARRGAHGTEDARRDAPSRITARHDSWRLLPRCWVRSRPQPRAIRLCRCVRCARAASLLRWCRRNVCHGSDSVEAAEREIGLWFEPGALPAPRTTATTATAASTTRIGSARFMRHHLQAAGLRTVAPFVLSAARAERLAGTAVQSVSAMVAGGWE